MMGLGKGNSLKKWQFWVSMLDFWGVVLFKPHAFFQQSASRPPSPGPIFQAADGNDHRVSHPCTTFSCHEVIGTLMFVHMPWLDHHQILANFATNFGRFLTQQKWDSSCLHEKVPQKEMKNLEKLREHIFPPKQVGETHDDYPGE